MADCPTCEYHKKRAQIWRDEAYRLAGHPLPERKKEWVGLTDEDRYEFAAAQYGWEDLLIAAEAKLKEKNT
jgi:hypothetical protein